MFYIVSALVLLLLVFGGSFFGAPWVPTRQVDYQRIEKLANLQKGQTLYDLGCGFGGLLFFLSKRHPDCRFRGVEIALLPYIISRVKCHLADNMRVAFGDIRRHDISRADVVYMFLTPKTHNTLRTKLIKELKPQAKIITACWGFDYNTNGSVDKVESQVSYFVYTANEITEGFTVN